MRKTRFMQEISGDLGDWWKKDAETQVQNYLAYVAEHAIVEDDGAIKWKSNGHYIPDDYCEVIEYGGYDFSREATAIKRDAQMDESIRQYRANPPKMTNEELFEMRSAFGEGTRVVNVITGQVYQL